MSLPILRKLALRCTQWSAQQCGEASHAVPSSFTQGVMRSNALHTKSPPPLPSIATTTTSSSSSPRSSSFLPSQAAATLQCLAVSAIALWSLSDSFTNPLGTKVNEKNFKGIPQQEHLRPSPLASCASPLSSGTETEDSLPAEEDALVFSLSAAAARITTDITNYLARLPAGSMIPTDTLTVLLQLLRRLALTYRRNRQKHKRLLSPPLSSVLLPPSSPLPFSFSDVASCPPQGVRPSPSSCFILPCAISHFSIALTQRVNTSALMLWATPSSLMAVNTISFVLECFPSPLPSTISHPDYDAPPPQERDHHNQVGAEGWEGGLWRGRRAAAAAGLLQLADDTLLALYEVRLPSMGDGELLIFMEHLSAYRKQQRRFALLYTTPLSPTPSSTDSSTTATINTSSFLPIRPTPRTTIWEATCLRCCHYSFLQRLSPSSRHRLAEAVLCGDDWNFSSPPISSLSFSSPTSVGSKRGDERDQKEKKNVEHNDHVQGEDEEGEGRRKRRREGISPWFSAVSVQEGDRAGGMDIGRAPGPHQQQLMRALVQMASHPSSPSPHRFLTSSTSTTCTLSHHASGTSIAGSIAYPALRTRLSSFLLFQGGSTSFSILLPQFLQVCERLISSLPSLVADRRFLERKFPKRSSLCEEGSRMSHNPTLQLNMLAWKEGHHNENSAAGLAPQLSSSLSSSSSPSSTLAPHETSPLFGRQGEESIIPNYEEEAYDTCDNEGEEGGEDRGNRGREVGEREGPYTWNTPQRDGEKKPKKGGWGEPPPPPGNSPPFFSFSSSSSSRVESFSPSPVRTVPTTSSKESTVHRHSISYPTQRGSTPSPFSSSFKEEGESPMTRSFTCTLQEAINLFSRMQQEYFSSPEGRGDDTNAKEEKEERMGKTNARIGQEMDQAQKSRSDTSRQRKKKKVLCIEEGMALLFCYTATRPLLWEQVEREIGKTLPVKIPQKSNGREVQRPEEEEVAVGVEWGGSGGEETYTSMDSLPSPSSFPRTTTTSSLFSQTLSDFSSAWNPLLMDVLECNLLWLAQSTSSSSSNVFSSARSSFPSRYFILLSLLLGENMKKWSSGVEAQERRKETKKSMNTTITSQPSSSSSSPRTSGCAEERAIFIHDSGIEKENKKEEEEEEEEEEVKACRMRRMKDAYYEVLRSFLQEEVHNSFPSTAPFSSLPSSTSSPSYRLTDSPKTKGARLWALMLGSCVLRCMESCWCCPSSSFTTSSFCPSSSLPLCHEVEEAYLTVLHSWALKAELPELATSLQSLYSTGTTSLPPASSTTIREKNHAQGEGEDWGKRLMKQEEGKGVNILSQLSSEAPSARDLASPISATVAAPAPSTNATRTPFPASTALPFSTKEVAHSLLELIHMMAMYWPMMEMFSPPNKAGAPSTAMPPCPSLMMVGPDVVASLLQSPILSRYLHPTEVLESLVLFSFVKRTPWWKLAIQWDANDGLSQDAITHTNPSSSLPSPLPPQLLGWNRYVTPFLRVYNHLLDLLTSYPCVEKYMDSISSFLPALLGSQQGWRRGSSRSRKDSFLSGATGEASTGEMYAYSAPSTHFSFNVLNVMARVVGGGGDMGEVGVGTLKEVERGLRMPSSSCWSPLPPPFSTSSSSEAAMFPLSLVPMLGMRGSAAGFVGLSLSENDVHQGKNNKAALSSPSCHSCLLSSSCSSSSPSVPAAGERDGRGCSGISIQDLYVDIRCPSYLPDRILDIYVRWLVHSCQCEHTHYPVIHEPSLRGVRNSNCHFSHTGTSGDANHPVQEETGYDQNGETAEVVESSSSSSSSTPPPASSLSSSSASCGDPISFAVILPSDTMNLLAFFEERLGDVKALHRAFQIICTRRLGQKWPLLRSPVKRYRSLLLLTQREIGEHKEEAGKEEKNPRTPLCTSPFSHGSSNHHHHHYSSSSSAGSQNRSDRRFALLPVHGLLRLLELLTPLYEGKEISYVSFARTIFDLLSSAASLQQCQRIPDLIPLAAVLSEPLCVTVRCGPALSKKIQNRVIELAKLALSSAEGNKSVNNGTQSFQSSFSFSSSSIPPLSRLGSGGDEEDENVFSENRWNESPLGDLSTSLKKLTTATSSSPLSFIGGTARQKGLLIAFIIRAELPVDDHLLQLFRTLTQKEKKFS